MIDCFSLQHFSYQRNDYGGFRTSIRIVLSHPKCFGSGKEDEPMKDELMKEESMIEDGWEIGRGGK